MRRIALIIIGLVLALALTACGTDRGYDAEPVVSADDQRETDVPDMDDEEGLAKQDCFRIEVWVNPALDLNRSDNNRTMGIACMVEPEESTVSGEPKQ